MKSGSVALVGAGPGDPDLITRRGLRYLSKATLVLYDALVASELLDEAPQARRLYVGKRAGRHAMPQRTIERLMIRYARRGERVVRLKCGDPFVFGRGGEEMLALAEAGVDCTIVPGVSSCIAAPQVAGIPVTHRDIASGFLCTTGHDVDAFAGRLRGISPGALTLIVLMSYRNRARLAATLLAEGYSGSTPAAWVSGATFDSQEVRVTTVSEMADIDMPDERAVTLIVGNVVSLAERSEGIGLAQLASGGIG
ncbi:MAG: uroporphyrinogen-III C-methyltransferase [Myxococcota bacterium]